jgi:hypothetical protein
VSAGARIREYYNVPAWQGGRIVYRGRQVPQQGTITGFSQENMHLRIRLDGEREIRSYHPTWMIDYLHSASCRESGSGPCQVCAHALETLTLDAGEAS